jgi:hypothetical protein
MVVSPLVVARSQLLTAIDLFFNDRDPISVHALADNAREILELMQTGGSRTDYRTTLARSSG